MLDILILVAVFSALAPNPEQVGPQFISYELASDKIMSSEEWAGKIVVELKKSDLFAHDMKE